MIVVEGKNDAHAIRNALGEVDIVWTEGFGLTEEKLNLIAEMAERRGVIICTDPDFVGRQIRDRISHRVPSAKHVYISRSEALNKKGNDIGIENVSPAEIRAAFQKVLKDKKVCETETIEMKDLWDNGLIGQMESAGKKKSLRQNPRNRR